MQNTTYILSTRPLDQTIIEEAAANNIVIDMLSFIHTTPVDADEVIQQVRAVALQETTVVFTSMNAVDAVTALLDNERPWWSIYCIGDTTGKLVSGYFGENTIAGTANSAVALAAVIMLDGVKELVFFCGDQRRPELPATLKSNDVAVEEVIVYRTITTPHVVTKKYDGILFFSPSAAESFFSANTADENTILFAIGDTTADTIKKFTNNPVITSVIPGKEVLAQQAIEYFKSVRALR
ncbi:MAG: uroporphyrinogen-III synthase [Chitinophagaceae bacterium]